MNANPKIQSQHLERQAYVYIRQSSMRQVAENLESQDLQYQLAQRAQGLGWSAVQVVVIDDDLGKSAISASDRSGFHTLVSAVGLAKVGIILVTDVSRLARNCTDWYQLLDLASLCGTLIGDSSGVYDPRDYNDRMLLGLKGTFSEAQWYHMRMHLFAALLNKARRGELAIRLPIGFERAADGKIVLSADQEVQSAIRLVFAQFDRLGSARAVMLWLHEQHLQLPRAVQYGPDAGQIEWVKPSYQAIYRILKHPAYAGAYTYGKHESTRLPGSERKIIIRPLPRSEWRVCIQNAFPGYIAWEQYLANQTRLTINAQGTNWQQGVARGGQALLQGLVWCGRCGRRMKLRYSNQPSYVCEDANKDFGEARCQNFMVPHIDQAVTRLFLEVVQPAQIEMALAAMEQIEAQRQQLAQQWQQRRERARYEADLARRRYAQVDPDNRLVAAELERRWEEKLQEVQRLEREWAEAQSRELKPLSEEDKTLIRQLASDIPALWASPTTTVAERKRLLRCLIESVTLNAVSQPGFSRVVITWHTGTTSEVMVERPRAGCHTDKVIVARVAELAQHLPDDQIAACLNGEQIPTVTGKPWNRSRIENVRKLHGIPTACPYFTRTPGPRGDGLTAASEAAERLGTSASMIAYWFRKGWIIGHQRKHQAPVWVRLSDADFQRWCGTMALQDDFIPITEAPAILGCTAQQLRDDIQAGRLLTYRLRVNHRWRWFVQPSDPQFS